MLKNMQNAAIRALYNVLKYGFVIRTWKSRKGGDNLSHPLAGVRSRFNIRIRSAHLSMQSWDRESSACFRQL